MNKAIGTSTTVSLFPFLEAFNRLKQEGIANSFLGSSKEQDDLIAMVPIAENFPKLPEEALKTLISKDVTKINEFLKSNGFDISLAGPIDLGVATIMDLLGTWTGHGDEVSVSHDNTDYPAVLLKGGVTLHNVSHSQILRITTKENFNVYLELNAAALSRKSLFSYLVALSAAAIGSPGEKCIATFPMVSIDEQPDVTWIQGLKVVGTENLYISEVVQQNKLAMNASGIRAQSAIAFGLRGLSMEEHVIVNQPFNLWITYGNEPFPLFGAYLAPDSWKNPGKLVDK